MHHYLEFMEECERLKDLFLLEGEEDKDAGESDDLAEMEPEDDPGKETPGDSREASAEEPADPMEDDTDLDLDSDLGDLTGDDSLEPEADQVNADERPGAINPATLYQEVTQAEDNIYDRTARAVFEKFPGGKCEVKDMLPIIAIGIKSYMKNKNYAALPKSAMKQLVFAIAKDIQSKLSGKNKEKPATEAIFYHKENPALTEGWKELAMAGAIAAAPMASHAATAESAPLSTHQGTSKVITNNRSMTQDSREMVNTRDNYGGKASVSKQAGGKSGKQVGKTSTPAKQGGGASEVPVVSDYSSVSFDDGTTYQVTPEQLKKMELVGNVPANYQVLDKNAKSSSSGKTAKAASSPSGKSAKSVTQSAVKQQAKAQTKSPSGKCPVDAERCGCGGQEDEDIDVEELAHKVGHKAVDAGIKGAKTAWGGLKGAAVGLWHGAKNAWNSAGKKIEQDHNKMIADRNK